MSDSTSARQQSAALSYNADALPPMPVWMGLAAQHGAMALMYLVYPALMIQECGLSNSAGIALISACLLTTGVATLLQALRRGPIGARLLAVQVANPIFLPLSMQALSAGGLALLAGMMIPCGLVQMLLAKLFRHLRTIFTGEICGMIIALLGFSMIQMSVNRFVGAYPGSEGFSGGDSAVGVFTLAVIIGLSVWGRGFWKLFAMLIGLAAGFAASLLAGRTDSRFASACEQPWICLPLSSWPGLRFDLDILLPFLLIGIISSLDSAGGFITCQKMNDPKWRRPDMEALTRGLLADGLGNVMAGLSGGFGMGVSSANIGLAMANGAISRIIGWGTGVLLVILSFFPRLAALLAAIPAPVMGAVLVYVAAVLILSGIQLVMTRLLDERRSAVIGLSMIAGMSVMLNPELFRQAPVWARPLFASPLSLAAVVAIGLNLLFKIGLRRTALLIPVSHDDLPAQIHAFWSDCGARWGACRHVVQKAEFAVLEVIEQLPGLVPGTWDLTASFDEHNLDARLRYPASNLPPAFATLSESPEILLDQLPDAAALSRHLVKQWTDKITARQQNGDVILCLHFDH